MYCDIVFFMLLLATYGHVNIGFNLLMVAVISTNIVMLSKCIHFSVNLDVLKGNYFDGIFYGFMLACLFVCFCLPNKHGKLKMSVYLKLK